MAVYKYPVLSRMLTALKAADAELARLGYDPENSTRIVVLDAIARAVAAGIREE